MLLDITDKKLINLLQENSKQTTKQLSLQLGLSVTAVYERIKKLEKEAIISKYVALVNHRKIDKSFLVFCHVKLEKHTKEYISVFEKEINKLEEVTECFHVSGDYDYILKIYVKDINQLIQNYTIKGIANITGGGLEENVNRVLPDGVDAVIDKAKIKVLDVFKKIQDYGNISEAEMYRVFNMGVGMVVISSDKITDCGAYEIGTIQKGSQKVVYV